MTGELHRDAWSTRECDGWNAAAELRLLSCGSLRAWFSVEYPRLQRVMLYLRRTTYTSMRPGKGRREAAILLLGRAKGLGLVLFSSIRF